MYEHHWFQHWYNISFIQHQKLYIDGSGDGISGETEITLSRYNTSGNICWKLIMFRWYFRIRNDGGSFDTANGTLPSWNNNHTIHLKSRHYSSSNGSEFHQTRYWDGEGSVFHQPSITITGYGSTT